MKSAYVRAGNAFYPQNYFVADSRMGFDIGIGRRASHYVPEFGSYPVWSNEIGCFDDEIADDTNITRSIYLTGDSFTWGYAFYEAKFGTLLKKRATVKSRLRRLVGHCSASAHIVYEVMRRLRSKSDSDSQSSKPGMRIIYELFDESTVYPYDTKFADDNREALLRWRRDASKNNYRLVIALIPPAGHASDPAYYSALRRFLVTHKFEYYEFSRSRFVSDEASAKAAYYWQFDPHFNIEGNAAYAEFLAESLGL